MKHALLAGLATGLATGAWMFAEYALGLHDDPAGAGRWTGFLALAFPVLGAWWIARRARLPSWSRVLAAGLVFGAVGGLVGGAAIGVYFGLVNPGFSVDGRVVDPGTQVLAGFLGALVLGTLLTLVMAALTGAGRSQDG